MRTFKRVIIVRRGDTALFQDLRDRFADDPGTVIMYDRRGSARRAAGDTDRTIDDERRWPQDDQVLIERGFYVVGRVPAPRRGLPPAQPSQSR